MFLALHPIVDQKAVAVPHTAMTIEVVKIITSTTVISPTREIFAAIGPITHNANTEKDPTIAMIVAKSGTRIDTVTARQTILIRSKTTNKRLTERRVQIAGDFWSASRSSFRVSVSRPHKASNAILSGLVPRANFVLCPDLVRLTAQSTHNLGVQGCHNKHPECQLVQRRVVPRHLKQVLTDLVAVLGSDRRMNR